MKKKRILVVDDNPAIHEDIFRCLSAPTRSDDKEIKELEIELFGDTPEDRGPLDVSSAQIDYIIEDAYQGEEAINMVDAAAASGNPYSLIFMDVRMPPGMDGIQTITQIWDKHPKIEVIICTAYSDYSWDDIVNQFGPTDNLLFMKKPFDTMAVKQAALSLTTKWDHARKNEERVKELEDRVEVRSNEMKAMMAHLERLKADTIARNIARNRFIANVSQEIKNPLNGILGITDLLLDTHLDDEQMDYAETIKNSSDTLLTLINEILDYSKIEEGFEKIDRIPFDLKNNLENVIQLMSGKTIEKDLELALLYSSDVPDWLIGDPLRIRQLLLNLLTITVNRSQTGYIIIRVSVPEPDQILSDPGRGADSVCLKLAVSNSGSSLTPDERRLLSEDSGADEQILDGNGMNSFIISRKIATLLGGNLTVKTSAEGETSIQFITRFEAANVQFRPQLKIPQTIGGLRCLVLCDYSSGRKVLSLYLKHWGAVSDEVSSIQQAAEKVYVAMDMNQPYTVVIVDLKGGDINALSEAARRLEHINPSRGLEKLKLVCLTGHSKRGDALAMKEVGYSAYLTKPIKQGQLIKCLLLLSETIDGNDKPPTTDILNKYHVDEIIPDHFAILVIDQNENRQKAIAASLLKLKILCDISDGEKSMVNTISRKRYALVLIHEDQLSPAIAKTIHQIRSSQRGKDLPMIAIVQTVDKNTRKDILQLGLNDFISWPLDQNEMVSVLGGYLR